MKQLTILVIYNHLALRGADQKLFRIRSPTYQRNFMRILLSPSSIALYSSYNNVSIFVGNTNFSSIWAPFHISDYRGLSIIDHLFYPVSIMFHKYYDHTSGVAGR
jgi:hypothetical protein